MNDDYQQILQKVSAKFDEIYGRNRAQMKCGRGCSSCCVKGLTVFTVEREAIRDYLLVRPELVQELDRLELQDPHKGERCHFLDENGDCKIYEVRPVICRTHGAPIFAKDEAGDAIQDVCPLNFTDLDEIDARDFINLEILNEILVLIDRRAGGGGDRFALRVRDVLGGQK